MRRFIALLGAMFLVLGIRLYNNGLLGCGYSGRLSVGTFDTAETESLLVSGPHRLDLSGDEETARNMIANLNGKLKFTESVDGMTIFYAYSPRLCSPVRIHGKQVNLMIAVSERGVTAGTPLIYGSF